MARRAQPYRVEWPLSAEQMEHIDEMFQMLFDDSDNGSMEMSADQITSGILVAPRGGTGFGEYVIGDLLYASATDELDTLADVATGNALISGGVGAAPSWGKIGLTTHVSGTLGVGNGGTGTATAFTAGSVVFAGTSGVYAQDNSNLFWDDTNNRLGIGVNTSLQAKLHIEDTLTVTGQSVRINVALNNSGAIAGVVSPQIFRLTDNSTANNLSKQAFRLEYVRSGTATGDTTAFDSMMVFAPTISADAPYPLRGITLEAPTVASAKTLESWAALYVSAPTGAGTLTTFVALATEGGQVVFNENGGDYDFRIESDAQTHAFFVEGTNGNIGIGNAAAPGAGTLGLFFGDGTAPSSLASNTAGLFAEDIGGTVGMHAINEAGLVAELNGTHGRAIAQTAAVTSVAAVTVGGVDASYEISANVLVTTATTHNFTVTCAYTDEGNTARTLTLGFVQLAGATFITAITNVTGAGPYESPTYHIRCKTGTTITIATTGVFTTVTYNVEGLIRRRA